MGPVGGGGSGGGIVHRRRRSGARVLKAAGADSREIRARPIRERDGRAIVSDRRPGEVVGGWESGVSGAAGSAGEDPWASGGVGRDRGSSGRTARSATKCGCGAGRGWWAQTAGGLRSGGSGGGVEWTAVAGAVAGSIAGAHGTDRLCIYAGLTFERQRQVGSQGAAGWRRGSREAELCRAWDGRGGDSVPNLGRCVAGGACGNPRQLLRVGRGLDFKRADRVPRQSGRSAADGAGYVPAPDYRRPGGGGGEQTGAAGASGSGEWNGTADPHSTLVLRTESVRSTSF